MAYTVKLATAKLFNDKEIYVIFGENEMVVLSLLNYSNYVPFISRLESGILFSSCKLDAHL